LAAGPVIELPSAVRASADSSFQICGINLTSAARRPLCKFDMEAPVSAPEAPVSESQNPAPAIAPTPTPTPNESSAPASVKPVHSLVVDANAIIKNDPPVSTLLSQAEQLYTIPAVVSEIRDEAARSRFQTTLQPFITLRTPRPESVQFVTDFARRTGDLQVLSKPDLHLLALTYELELERNGGDWRLRKDPAQKRVNGKPPGRSDEGEAQEQKPETESSPAAEQAPGPDDVKTTVEGAAEPTAEEVAEAIQRLDIAADRGDESGNIVEVDAGSASEEEVEDDGDGEWISEQLTLVSCHWKSKLTITSPEQRQEASSAGKYVIGAAADPTGAPGGSHHG
jgi:RNA-binding protein NOB1